MCGFGCADGGPNQRRDKLVVRRCLSAVQHRPDPGFKCGIRTVDTQTKPCEEPEQPRRSRSIDAPHYHLVERNFTAHTQAGAAGHPPRG
jgi:hypothetical protein